MKPRAIGKDEIRLLQKVEVQEEYIRAAAVLCYAFTLAGCLKYLL